MVRTDCDAGVSCGLRRPVPDRIADFLVLHGWVSWSGTRVLLWV